MGIAGADGEDSEGSDESRDGSTGVWSSVQSLSDVSHCSLDSIPQHLSGSEEQKAPAALREGLQPVVAPLPAVEAFQQPTGSATSGFTISWHRLVTAAVALFELQCETQ